MFMAAVTVDRGSLVPLVGFSSEERVLSGSPAREPRRGQLPVAARGSWAPCSLGSSSCVVRSWSRLLLAAYGKVRRVINCPVCLLGAGGSWRGSC